MEQPRINVSRASGVAVVALAGEHDLSTMPSVEDELGRIGPARPCIVDLSAAAFIDSSILGVLIRFASSPEPPRCAGVVAPPGSAAGRLFALTAADRLLPVFESTDEAIRALRRAGDALVDWVPSPVDRHLQPQTAAPTRAGVVTRRPPSHGRSAR